MTRDRHHTIAVKVGSVTIGGRNPIVVQSMTNTDTADVDATTKQVRELAIAGSELVRITVNTSEAAAKVATKREKNRWSWLLCAFSLRLPLQRT